MNVKKVLQILDNAKASGAAIEIDLKTIPSYIKYKRSLPLRGKKETNINKRLKYGISLVQTLIDASNLDKAEELLDDIENESNGKKFMGAIWEKRGWISDYRQNYDDEIKYFKKAKDIYERIPESLDVEGRKEDRLLTVEHFTGRALYFRGRKSDLDECERLFNDSLEGYRKLEREDAIAFNYSWLARVAIAQNDLEKARDLTKKAEEFFEKASKSKGNSIKAYAYRLKSELAIANGKKEESVKYSCEGLRLTLPAGTYYNGVIEAVKNIIKASNS